MSNLLKKGERIKRMLAAPAGLMVTIIILTTPSPAQNAASASALETALAGSAVARVESPWCAQANAAALAGVAAPSLLFSSSPSSIGIEGYYEGSLVAAMPIDSVLSIGGIAEALGVEGYREIGVSLIGARQLPGGMAFGVTLALRAIAIDGYGAALAPCIGVAGLAHLSGAIRFGVSVTNLARSRIGGRTGGSDLPQRIAAGFAFDLPRGTVISIDLLQELRRRGGISLGVSTAPLKGLTLRAGASNAPGRIAFGAGYDNGMLLLDVAAAYVQPLGFRHVLGIGLRW